MRVFMSSFTAGAVILLSGLLSFFFSPSLSFADPTSPTMSHPLKARQPLVQGVLLGEMCPRPSPHGVSCLALPLPLPGATVRFRKPGKVYETTTGESGKFSIELPSDSYLVTSASGGFTLRKNIRVVRKSGLLLRLLARR